MRVLVVGPSPFKSKGGMATVIKEIIEDRDLCDIYNIESYSSYADGNKVYVLFYSLISFAWFFLTKRNYDVYHIHAASRGSTFRKGWYVKTVKKWKKKVVFHIHGAQYMEFYDELSNKKKGNVRDILKVSDLVVALSNDWKNKFEKTFGITNCVVLENGINVSGLALAVNSPIEHQKEFVMLGRMGKRKGTFDLVCAVEKAVKMEPELKCYLAGDGEVEKVKKLVAGKHLEKNIIIIGWADFEKKISLLSNVSTVVLPSYNEGLPMAILEGMACGKAIISTKVGAIPEVIKDGKNGILINPGDVDALAAALVKCCRNTVMISQMSISNMTKINEEYSTAIMHSKLMKFYNQLMR
ncbi:glycosyltransferase family 4 protein [Bacillus sp. OK048]|uniref:glycosyltransferase family 4 protein n=1 Tax=Bacillus sp. OK048 TaxID=1882761 RepID=UPI00088AE26B|nr:glycosyltransferase family 4 protein [Bacillus sp. OK048]SDN05418.1 Glycosyltransferase involved in cell wall bisynthesis [Bacillus sp. OK048]